MIYQLIFVVFVVGVAAESEVQLWHKFKNEHKRTYTSVDEEARRFEIFKENLDIINEHNAKYIKGETTWYKGINQFSDMTQEEFSEKYLTQIFPPLERDEATLPDDDVPDFKDWKAEGVVTKVKNQGICGACYAFASVASLESHNAIVNKELINLSVQELIDCSAGDTYLNAGCSGGIIEGSFHYVMDHGIQAQASYPFAQQQLTCRANPSLNVVSVKAYKNVPEDESLLKTAVGTIGPVAACADASTWSSYAGGVIDGSCNADKATNHVISLVGYGTENGTDYWYVKNSWGTNWGLDGYLKIRRNNNNAFCISTYTAYPIMN